MVFPRGILGDLTIGMAHFVLRRTPRHSLVKVCEVTLRVDVIPCGLQWLSGCQAYPFNDHSILHDLRGLTLPDLDGPIRANRFADLRESPDSRESFQGSRAEPLFANRASGGLKIVNRGFEAIRANRLHVMRILYIGVFL